MMSHTASISQCQCNQIMVTTSWRGNTFRVAGPLWGESPVASPHRKGSVMLNFDAFFVVSRKKLLDKQAMCRWFEALMWRHCNTETEMSHFHQIFITGCIGSCHFHNFLCSQWWKFRQNGDISISGNGWHWSYVSSCHLIEILARGGTSWWNMAAVLPRGVPSLP